tara:strand:- start:683 stop:865 length:183 start_codon:yes stop_codon:yes gene_type:complete
MDQEQAFTQKMIDINTLRVLYRVANEAYDTLPCLPDEEHKSLYATKQTLYAALLDELFDL